MRQNLIDNRDKTLRKRLILLLTTLVVVIGTACNNDHCNESMYAPMSLVLKSEVDTAKEVAPTILYIQGIDNDSIMMLSNQTNLSINLNSSTTTCQYLFMVGHPMSAIDTLLAASEELFYTRKGEPIKQIWNNGMLFKFEDGRCYYVKEFIPEVGLTFYVLDTDTLNIVYENEVDFVSAECGCMTTHKLTSAQFLHDRVGSATIINPQITNMNNEKHIRIYLANY